MDPAQTLTGFLVGVLVGFTGMGGGAVMTPVLIMVLGVAPSAAVGTDVFYAFFTKIAGAAAHGYQKTVCWKTVRWLWVGSVPGALIASALFSRLQGVLGADFDSMVAQGLGIILIITALAPFAAGRYRKAHEGAPCRPADRRILAVVGFIVGFLVTFTSVGSGVLVAAAIFTLFPGMPAARVVGTDVTHAVALLAVAGAGHTLMGNVNFPLAGMLLIGSIPGVLLGSSLAARVPEKPLRLAASVIMFTAGAKLV
ncbi:MAG: sulfite exporter TauE/SafE family protein [Nitrospinota bacterium]|nr:sulfite exporter TauE/SafE family protein [Nitrospinota bacterium]